VCSTPSGVSGVSWNRTGGSAILPIGGPRPSAKKSSASGRMLQLVPPGRRGSPVGHAHALPLGLGTGRHRWEHFVLSHGGLSSFRGSDFVSLG